MSSEKFTALKLVLVGEPYIGKSALCREWSPEFTPMDGYHIHHWNNVIYTNIPDIKTPPSSHNELLVIGDSAKVDTVRNDEHRHCRSLLQFSGCENT